MDPFLARLEQALSDTSDVLVNSGVNAKIYCAELAADIRANTCVPFPLSATVMAPGFPESNVGSVISGHCVAQNAGYWLVYQPENDRFLCFWGVDRNNLGAHGVFGSPVYCWSA